MSIAFLLSTQGLLQYSKLCGEKYLSKNDYDAKKAQLLEGL
jgi:hypothetical protein